VLRWCCASAAPVVLRWCCSGVALVLRWCCWCWCYSDKLKNPLIH
jgi:hypothetical protein